MKRNKILVLNGQYYGNAVDGLGDLCYSKQNFFDNPKEYKLNYGVVPEVSNAFSDYTVLQNLKFSAGIYGITSKEEIETIRPIMKTFGPNMAPIIAWLLIRGIRTLGVRIDRQNQNAN